jgi:hypothetical protein
VRHHARLLIILPLPTQVPCGSTRMGRSPRGTSRSAGSLRSPPGSCIGYRTGRSPPRIGRGPRRSLRRCRSNPGRSCKRRSAAGISCRRGGR